MEYKQLIEKAIMMTDYSYVPYSHFHVGAALLCKVKNKSGKRIFTGCNIENSAFGPSIAAAIDKDKIEKEKQLKLAQEQLDALNDIKSGTQSIKQEVIGNEKLSSRVFDEFGLDEYFNVENAISYVNNDAFEIIDRNIICT